MSNTCLKCSSPLDDDASFCPECGTTINLQCPSCEKSINPSSKFCKYCACDLAKNTGSKNPAKLPASSSGLNLTPKEQFSSGIDVILKDKYRAMSDARLLAQFNGDLSGYTEKTLEAALAELETRKNIDSRDLDIVKVRVNEALVVAKTYGGNYRPSYKDNNQSSEQEKADKLIKIGAAAAVISVIVFLLGNSYVNNFSNMARAGMMKLAGQTDGAYALAQFAVTLGVIGFIVGIVLLIIGFTRR